MAVHLKQMVSVGMMLGAAACVVTWFLTSENSPFYDHLLINPTVRNHWGVVNFPAFIAAMLFRLPDSDAVGFSIIFIQWFIIGSFGCVVTRSLMSLCSELSKYLPVLH
jgi:hypothetical protein